MIPGLPTIEVESFFGQLDKASLRDVPKQFSPDCPNCAFDVGSVSTRPGTVLKIDWGADVTNVLKMDLILGLGGFRYHLGLIVTAGGTEFAYFKEGAGARVTLIAVADLTQTATHFRYAVYGNLVFIVFSNTAAGIDTPFVWNPATDTVDEATHDAPDTSGMAAAAGGAGNVTAGLHKIIQIWRTRTGYETVPGSTVVEFTAAADSTINVTGLDVGGADNTITDIIIGMTLADDERYFEVAVQADEEDSTYTINISDEQLINQRSLDGHFLHMHPLKNFLNVFLYKDRMIWVAPSDEASLIWVSEAGKPISIRSDTGYIPIGREDGDRCTAAFSIRKALYICKTRSIWATQDTNGDPATWEKPYPVCRWAGTVSPSGVSQTTDKDEAFIFDIKGVLRFQGGDPQLASENISGTFDRLNYGQLGKAVMAVDPLESRVFAWVPLGSATNPATLIVGDFKEGWARSKWSLWTTTGTAWRDIAVDSAEVLIQEAGRYLTRFDDHANAGLPASPTLNDRSGAGIAGYYVTGLIEGKRKGGIQNISEVTIYGGGTGNLDMEVRGQDGTALTPALTALALTESPGKDLVRGMNYSQERFFFKFGTDAAGERFNVSRLIFNVSAEGVRPH
jgi:hypothetical protein